MAPVNMVLGRKTNLSSALLAILVYFATFTLDWCFSSSVIAIGGPDQFMTGLWQDKHFKLTIFIKKVISHIE